MLTDDVLPLINEAADRVYSLVRETPLAPLGTDELQINANCRLRQARAIAAQRLLQIARCDQ